MPHNTRSRIHQQSKQKDLCPGWRSSCPIILLLEEYHHPQRGSSLLNSDAKTRALRQEHREESRGRFGHLFAWRSFQFQFQLIPFLLFFIVNPLASQIVTGRRYVCVTHSRHPSHCSEVRSLSLDLQSETRFTGCDGRGS